MGKINRCFSQNGFKGSLQSCNVPFELTLMSMLLCNTIHTIPRERYSPISLYFLLHCIFQSILLKIWPSNGPPFQQWIDFLDPRSISEVNLL